MRHRSWRRDAPVYEATRFVTSSARQSHRQERTGLEEPVEEDTVPRASKDSRAPRRQPARERRIYDEIIVDAYGPEEQAMGWYYYLERTLGFPFPARCRTARAISPLRVSEAVTVTGMAPEEECEREMYVTIRWQDRARRPTRPARGAWRPQC
jgi:hypothetical protein